MDFVSRVAVVFNLLYFLCIVYLNIGLSLDGEQYHFVEIETGIFNQVSTNERKKYGQHRQMLESLHTLQLIECDAWELNLKEIYMSSMDNEQGSSCFHYGLQKVSNDNCNMSNSINHLMISFPNVSLTMTHEIDNSIAQYYANVTQCDTIQLHDMYKIFKSAIPNQVGKKHFDMTDYASNLAFSIEYDGDLDIGGFTWFIDFPTENGDQENYILCLQHVTNVTMGSWIYMDNNGTYVKKTTLVPNVC